jgi:hypothetical protein
VGVGEPMVLRTFEVTLWMMELMERFEEQVKRTFS